MKTNEQIIVELGHAGDEEMPTVKRIRLYRALAATSNRTDIAAHFFQCADELAASEQKIGQLTLGFGVGKDGGVQ